MKGEHLPLLGQKACSEISMTYQVIQVLVSGFFGRWVEALSRVELEDDLLKHVEDGLSQHVGLAVQMMDEQTE